MALPNWYAIKNVSLAVVSYVSDDVPNYNQLPNGFTLAGPYASQAAAQAANQSVVITPAQTTINTLAATASAAWTLANVADWLKAKG